MHCVCCVLQGLRSLFGTLMLSLPAFWNVGGLLALMFFIYAYVGMLLLGHVKRNGWVDGPWGHVLRRRQVAWG